MSKKILNMFTIGVFVILTMVVNAFPVFSATTYYNLVVSDGSGSGFYAEGDLVTITADEFDNETFKMWESDSSKVEFLNQNSSTTAFEMPAEDVNITAYYINNEDIEDDEDIELYRLIIRNTYNSVEVIEYYAEGEIVEISARNYTYSTFYRWTTSYSGVYFDSSRDQETTFEMPGKNVVIIANYEDVYEKYPVVVIDGYGDGDYEPGDLVKIEAIPTAYEEFSHWTSSDDITFRDAYSENTYFTMIDESVRVIARYNSISIPMSTVTVSSGLGGGNYMEGDVVTIQVSSGQGQVFSHWQTSNPDVTFYNAYSTITSFLMPDDDVTVYPIFTDSYGNIIGNYGYNTNNTTSGSSHVITTSVLGGGQIFPSGNVFVNRLSGQTFTMLPDTGYEVSFVVVDGQPMGSLSEYTFKNVIADHTIQVVFRSTTLNNTIDFLDNPFIDVKTNYWFYNAVMEVYQKGLMTGTSSTVFSPYSGATRASISALLYRLENNPPTYLSSNLFPDVFSNQWYTDSVIWCYENGIISGYDDGYFYPEKDITREELSAILHRYGSYKGMNMSRLADLSTYADANEVAPWAKMSVSWAIGSNLLYGKEFGFIQPKATSSRAELAVVLVELLAHLNM